MNRFTSINVRIMMHIQNTRWIAVAIISLFTHATMAQSHRNLSAAIEGGNDALSESVHSLQTTAYVNEGQLQIAGEGLAVKLEYVHKVIEKSRITGIFLYYMSDFQTE